MADRLFGALAWASAHPLEALGRVTLAIAAAAVLAVVVVVVASVWRDALARASHAEGRTVRRPPPAMPGPSTSRRKVS
jgi:multisubunit Na+/H+ antiporter MnhG subunit